MRPHRLVAVVTKESVPPKRQRRGAAAVSAAAKKAKLAKLEQGREAPVPSAPALKTEAVADPATTPPLAPAPPPPLAPAAPSESPEGDYKRFLRRPGNPPVPGFQEGAYNPFPAPSQPAVAGFGSSDDRPRGGFPSAPALEDSLAGPSQRPTIPTLSPAGAVADGFVKEPPVRRLAGTATCLRCAKQLRNGGIFCSRPAANSRCFRCAKNNDKCLPVPVQHRAGLLALQTLADSVEAGEGSLSELEKEGKKWVSAVEKTVKLTTPRRGSVSAAVGGAPEAGRLLAKISLQLEQMTEVLYQLAGRPVPPVPDVEEEFGGGEVVEK
ncbi:hypothetical protein AJ78_06512 [Emergomyces pasteurianus Ep9510]|uniref:Uncharacterized protein n=1 Tax=Emergomyces pasteurianus Ep9510 TaxID=1447872 RepID=A0A1J9QAL3_9EURO|nr:hypothetical protein AJ78_06512 [Emergomyces pasteurianus Ep9510]